MPDWYWIIIEVVVVLLICFAVFFIGKKMLPAKGRRRSKKQKSNAPENYEDIKPHLNNVKTVVGHIKEYLDLKDKNNVYNQEDRVAAEMGNLAADLNTIFLEIKQLLPRQNKNKRSSSTGAKPLPLQSSSAPNLINKGFSQPPANPISFEMPPQKLGAETEATEERPYPVIDLSRRNPVAEFTEVYNLASTDRERRQDFWAKYQNSQRFGNKNAYAQARGETADFDFCSEDSGDFIAVKLVDSANFMVVPQFGTTITETSFNEGGFGFVFDCANYQRGASYSLTQVVEPAEFERRGEQWVLVNRGKLFLQS